MTFAYTAPPTGLLTNGENVTHLNAIDLDVPQRQYKSEIIDRPIIISGTNIVDSRSPPVHLAGSKCK